MQSSLSRANNNINSQVMFVMERYSTSADDLEIICCFFDFHQISKSPIKMQKPMIDLVVPR